MAQPAQPSISDWQKQWSKASSDSTRLRLCLAISQYYYSKTQYDSLYPYVQQGLTFLPKSPSHAYAAELNFLLSRYYRYKGQYKKGIPYGQLAVEHALKNRHPKRTAELQYYLAVLYLDARDGSKAVDQIGANLRYLRKYDDGPTRAANYVLMINLFEELNNTAMQKLYWQKYVALDKRFWPAEDKMLAYGNMGEVLEREGKLKEAESLFRKALYYAKLTPAPAIPVANSLEYLGVNLRKQGKHQQAIKVFKEAFNEAKSIRNASQMSSAKRELALTYLAFHNPRQALLQAQQALSIAQQYKKRDWIMNALNSLSKILETQGNYRQALALYQQEQQLREQKSTEINVQKIAQMQAQFEAETKENTIKLLQKNAQIDHLNALRQYQQLILARRTQVGASLLILILLVVAGLTTYSLRKSRRNNALLNQQRVLIQQTASQLVESNQVKDKLFSLISHDLRSPMSRLKNDFYQFRQTSQLPPTLITPINQLEDQLDRILNLLTNLLDWSLTQLKGFTANPQRIDLADAVSEAITSEDAHLRQKNIGLLRQIPSQIYVFVDKHQFDSILRNVLSNAVKFTPNNGYIRIWAISNGSQTELYIKDTGIGMSPDQLARVLTDPHIRPGTQDELSTGLGLRLCQELLAHQSGSLQISSQPQKGTLIKLTLKSN